MSTCSYTLEPCIGVSHLKEERGRSEQKASSSTLGLYPWCQCALQAQSRPPTCVLPPPPLLPPASSGLSPCCQMPSPFSEGPDSTGKSVSVVCRMEVSKIPCRDKEWV